MLTSPIVHFVSHDTASQELTEAHNRNPNIWIFTDGSIKDGGCGAVALFEDARGPFGTTTLTHTLEAIQSSEDAEILGSL